MSYPAWFFDLTFEDGHVSEMWACDVSITHAMVKLLSDGDINGLRQLVNEHGDVMSVVSKGSPDVEG